MKINPLVEKLQPSATLALNQKAKALAAQGNSIVNLTVGEPDFPTPERIRNAAKKAIDGGETYYTATSGILPLREAIARIASARYGRTWTSKNVTVSNGAKQSLFNLFYTLLRPQDEVVFFSPYWVSYSDIVLMVGGTPIVVETKLEKGFQPNISDLERSITSKTKIILLNSPSNPTGVAYTGDFLSALGNFLKKHPHILVVTDDIYGQLVFDGKPFLSIGMQDSIPQENLLIVDGVSKSYAMTGWRIGWTISSEKIALLMDNVQSQTTSNASSISQWAALEAVTGEQHDVSLMRQAFESRRNMLDEQISKHLPVRYVKPHGAFYFFLSCDVAIGKRTPKGKQIENDVDFCMFMLEDCGVALVPGSAFGAPGYMRLSFGLSEDQLQEGIKRMERGFGLLK